MPNWVKVGAPAPTQVTTLRLGAGETAAIALAREIGAKSVLIDERKGRKVVMAHGLRPISTLTVLEFAAARQLLDLKSAIESLRRTTFYITEEHIRAALLRDAARKTTGENFI